MRSGTTPPNSFGSGGPPPPPPPAPSSFSSRPHESSLGDMPVMESAPSSGNFAMMNVATSTAVTAAAAAGLTLNPLPPPPPPPKVRTTTNHRTLSPLRSGGTSSGSTSKSSSTASNFTSLPPPPKVAPSGGSSHSSIGNFGDRPTQRTTASSSFPPPPPVKVLTAGGPPPPPPRLPPPPPAPMMASTTTNNNSNNNSNPDPPALADGMISPSYTESFESSSDAAFTHPPPRLPLTTFLPPVDPQRGPPLLARRQTHIPVLIISTESAQMIAWKNGLQLVDLFQGIIQDGLFGFGTTTTTSSSAATLPPFRSVHRSLTLQDLKVDFVDPEELSPSTYARAHGLLQENAKLQESDGNIAQELILLEDRVEMLLQDPTEEEAKEDLAQVTKDAYQLTSPLNIPWLIRYRYALDASTNALPHDLIQSPPMVLLVCSSDEVESPLQVLQELYSSPHILPDCFKNGLYDPAAMRQEVLVLHDNVEGPPNFDDNSLRSRLKTQFGPQSQVLRINNVPKDVAAALADEEDADVWGGNGSRGTRLSINDRALLRRYFQSLFTSALLPALERRISNLNAVVSERKKGVRNLVKSFWRKPKEEREGDASLHSAVTSTTTTTSMTGTDSTTTTTTVLVQYRFDSIESQTRLLADTLFLMQDYDAALSTYKLIRDDFKSDKALVHYASVQEMMALCMYHLDTYGRARDIFSCLETALLSYTRAAEDERRQMMAGRDSSARPPTAPHATRLATRLCLLLATASDALTKGRELEVADLLASASSHESSLGAAVLLEQASAFYYEASMFRKYAFHMLMSGHMFRTANQDHHAFRCFCSALYIYRHGQWAELHNHLKSALAAQLYTMGRMSVALILYAKLVEGAGKVSSKSQQKFLTHLLEICLEHPKKALAGADRMAAPPHVLTTREREAIRNDRLERIVKVIQYTPGASRVLELPYMNLPRICDSSVRIWTHAEEHFLPSITSEEPAVETELDSSRTLGKILKGDDEVWDELQLLTTAECNAVNSTVRGLDENVTAALSKVNDPQHRQVIAQIDKEKQIRALMERSRRNGSLKSKPHVRARMEPMFCDFTAENPLSVAISLTKLQLVARMVDSNDTLCTNQDAIQISASSNEVWTFPSTEQQEFGVPDFCRVSEKGQKSCRGISKNPFFVVTKQSLELEPGMEGVVSAGLTPLVEGDLEILGVRYLLSDQVWVYHPFHIPGPLLNDTRSNRANRVRGESLVLKSKIAVGMPCITAEMVKRSSPTTSPIVNSDDGPLLDGQISNWTIRLRNIGSAPANQLMLKTNLPWINIPGRSNEADSEEALEGEATSHCLGPTGTLMGLPLNDARLKESGIIHPGEVIDIPIQLRTSGSGRKQFYMLYRYDLFNNNIQEKSRTRWLRKMYEVPVFPTLSISSRIVGSTWKDNEQLLTVEITNTRTDRPTDLYLTLDKLSLASRRYRLEALPGQFAAEDKAGDVLQIGWQERMTAHYRVIPNVVQSKTCSLSECPFSDDAAPKTLACVKTDSLDFLWLERACETFEAAWTSHQKELIRAEHDEGGGNHPRSIASIRRANTSDSTTIPDDGEDSAEIHPTSIAKLFPPESSDSTVHLLCNWRAILGEEVIRGEHHVRAVSIQPKTFFDGCPINATAAYPRSLCHDFATGPAIVPVTVTLRNNMLESPVNFFVSAEKNHSFEMIGLEILLLSLEANEDIEIPFEALIPRPGVHNLQALELKIRQGGQDQLFKLHQQWLIQITDSSPTN